MTDRHESPFYIAVLRLAHGDTGKSIPKKYINPMVSNGYAVKVELNTFRITLKGLWFLHVWRCP